MKQRKLVESLMRHFGRYLKTSRTVNSALTNVVNSRNLERTRKPAFISSILNPETLHLASLLRGNYVREAGRNWGLRSGRGVAIIRQTILVWISMSSRGSLVQGEGRHGRLFVERDDTFGRWWLRSLTIDTRYVTSVVACPWGDRRFHAIYLSCLCIMLHSLKKKCNATEKI